ncbi:MAG: class I mannose-6-phosphate isomerase [Chloroflexi bacterium]|nr:class I mannose-6-phosphate isomerase [Chloroflexota bacterium]
MIKQPVSLIPEYREYVWGGARLRPEVVPTAEAWIVYQGNRIASGPYAGRTLADIAAENGAAFLGRRAVEQTGTRFPVLVKLLDCAQWLSLQVHPNDEQAAALEGPGFFGKTEAWQVLEAEPGAKLIAGMQPGVSAEGLAESIRSGTVLETVQMLEVQAGQTLFMSPGTIHALGPGLLIYEIQQTSDLTYRVYDWGRPQTETRKLHIEKALAVSRPDASSAVMPAPVLADGETRMLTECQYFHLDLIAATQKRLELDTQGESFHALTAIEGRAEIIVADESYILERFSTLVIPAACGAYSLQPLEACRILKASV